MHIVSTQPYWDGCVDAVAMALLLVRCRWTELRRLPPLLALQDRSANSRPPRLCRLPLLYTHSVSADIGVTCAIRRRSDLGSARQSHVRKELTRNARAPAACNIPP